MNHFCEIHDIEYTKHEKDGKSWYSHKLSTGKWCNEGKTEEKPTQAPAIPVKQTETREPVPQDLPYKPRDFDAENRGKVRHGIIVARTENIGVVPLLPDEAEVINTLVEFVMSGKVAELNEDVEDIELPSEIIKET